MGRPRKDETRKELQRLGPGGVIHIGTPVSQEIYNALVERAQNNLRSVAAELRVAVIAWLGTKPVATPVITEKKAEVAETKASNKNKKT